MVSLSAVTVVILSAAAYSSLQWILYKHPRWVFMQLLVAVEHLFVYDEEPSVFLSVSTLYALSMLVVPAALSYPSPTPRTTISTSIPFLGHSIHTDDRAVALVLLSAIVLHLVYLGSGWPRTPGTWTMLALPSARGVVHLFETITPRTIAKYY